ncbi:MAG: LysM peptidoglycan-binding domain-containing protein [Spirochaetaceae bacterium]|jgi:hypothetical protein|nr:LysM peptidoglycan-binding domain-containing protein [Spirochaetaceae bacterium]
MTVNKPWVLWVLAAALTGTAWAQNIGIGEIEEAYRDTYEKITGTFGLYEKYLPKNRLIQLKAVRRTAQENSGYDINHVLRVSKPLVDECDRIVLENLADRLDTAGLKYERLESSSPQLQTQYAEFSRKRAETPELLVTKAGLEEIEAFVNTVDALYAEAAWLRAPGERTVPPGEREGTEGRYLVKEGDFLRDIARRLYGDEMQWRRIYRANPVITNPDLIYPGMEFVIPPRSSS